MRWLVFALPLVLLGCENKPSAPALTNETIYRQDDIGIRFAAPDGWLLRAKSALPPGKLTTPIRVVEYARTTETTRADFDLYAVDLDGQGVLEYLTKEKIGSENWQAQGTPKETTLGGLPAKVYQLVGSGQRANMRREITSVTREDHTYLFLITHSEKDSKALQEAHKALETVAWK
ncbi:MAG: hypothetical protein ACRC8S_13825 [Fimbriiglobus sp.]